MKQPEKRWLDYLTEYDHQRTAEKIDNLKPGYKFTERYWFYVTILSTKNSIYVLESSVDNKEGDIVEFADLEAFKEEYSLSKDKYWLEFMNETVLDDYWAGKALDCA